MLLLDVFFSFLSEAAVKMSTAMAEQLIQEAKCNGNDSAQLVNGAKSTLVNSSTNGESSTDHDTTAAEKSHSSSSLVKKLGIKLPFAGHSSDVKKKSSLDHVTTTPIDSSTSNDTAEVEGVEHQTMHERKASDGKLKSHAPLAPSNSNPIAATTSSSSSSLTNDEKQLSRSRSKSPFEMCDAVTPVMAKSVSGSSIEKREAENGVDSTSTNPNAPVPAPRKGKSFLKTLFGGLSGSNSSSQEASTSTSSPKPSRKSPSSTTSTTAVAAASASKEKESPSADNNQQEAKQLNHFNKNRARRANVRTPTTKHPLTTIIASGEDEDDVGEDSKKTETSEPIQSTTAATATAITPVNVEVKVTNNVESASAHKETTIEVTTTTTRESKEIVATENAAEQPKQQVSPTGLANKSLTNVAEQPKIRLLFYYFKNFTFGSIEKHSIDLEQFF